MQEAWTVPGSKLIITMLESPTILGSIIIIWVVILVTIFLRRSGRKKQIIKLSVAILVTLAIIVGLAYSFRPGTQYGLVIKGETLTVTFFEDKSVSFNICNSRIELLNRTSGISLLHLRKFGISDPATGLNSGYFISGNGTSIYTIITGKNVNHVILVENKRYTALVGVPNIEKAYTTLINLQGECKK